MGRALNEMTHSFKLRHLRSVVGEDFSSRVAKVTASVFFDFIKSEPFTDAQSNASENTITILNDFYLKQRLFGTNFACITSWDV